MKIYIQNLKINDDLERETSNFPESETNPQMKRPASASNLFLRKGCSNENSLKEINKRTLVRNNESTKDLRKSTSKGKNDYPIHALQNPLAPNIHSLVLFIWSIFEFKNKN